MPKKAKPAPKMMKPCNCKIPDYKKNLNYDIEKAIKPNTINPKEIFETYQDTAKGKKVCPKGKKVCDCHLKKLKPKKRNKTSK
tara:strand:+ start:13427 stop:13675 length:249 start_codon:yes stop_codon:yes gene_type:complete